MSGQEGEGLDSLSRNYSEFEPARGDHEAVVLSVLAAWSSASR